MIFSDYIPDLIAIGPELILCATVLIVLLVDLWRMGRDHAVVWILAPAITFACVYGLFVAGKAYVQAVPGTVNNPLLPEFIGIVLAYAAVTVGDLWFRGADGKARDGWVPGIVCLIGVALAGYRLSGQSGAAFTSAMGDEAVQAYWGQLVIVDAFSVVFRGIVLVSLAVSTWYTIFYRPMQRGPGSRGVVEFLACLLGAHIGGMFLVGTTQLLFIFLALETLSLCSYMQAGMLKGDRRSAEASLKYIIYGSVASGLMLFGFSLLYAFGGELTLDSLAAAVKSVPRTGADDHQAAAGVLITVGLLSTVGGLAYKLSLVPFHFWTPDVYEGSPTPTAAFLSVGSKAAAFGVLLRFVSGLTGDINWAPSLVALLAFVAAITMTYGNLAALRQPNLKRLLAYSSIAHAGYMLMGVCAVFQFERDAAGAVTGSAFLSTGYEAIVFYLIAYLLMNLGIFGVVIYLANKTGSEEIDDLRGLGWKSPWVSGALIVFLLSLTGIPPTAGFFAKYYLFYATVKAGYLWLVIIAILNTVVSLFYYFRIAKELFLKTEEQALFSAPRSVLLAGCVILLAAATVWFGLAPDGMNDAVVKAATSIHAQVGR